MQQTASTRAKEIRCETIMLDFSTTKPKRCIEEGRKERVAVSPPSATLSSPAQREVLSAGEKDRE